MAWMEWSTNLMIANHIYIYNLVFSCRSRLIAIPKEIYLSNFRIFSYAPLFTLFKTYRWYDTVSLHQTRCLTYLSIRCFSYLLIPDMLVNQLTRTHFIHTKLIPVLQIFFSCRHTSNRQYHESKVVSMLCLYSARTFISNSESSMQLTLKCLINLNGKEKHVKLDRKCRIHILQLCYVNESIKWFLYI